MKEDFYLIDNFKYSEFNYVYPDYYLLTILQEIRNILKKPIKITSGPREIYDHIRIYKQKYGNNWYKKIPFKSRHLPTFETSYLRAVDIICKNTSGCILKEIAMKARDKINKKIYLGLGTGNTFLHIDVDRKYDTFWEY